MNEMRRVNTRCDRVLDLRAYRRNNYLRGVNLSTDSGNYEEAQLTP